MAWDAIVGVRTFRFVRKGTSFGETLSWEYYNFVRRHPITQWDNPTPIVYGENDNLTEREVLDSFAWKFHCRVTGIKDGKHSFHAPGQLRFLQDWIGGAGVRKNGCCGHSRIR